LGVADRKAGGAKVVEIERNIFWKPLGEAGSSVV